MLTTCSGEVLWWLNEFICKHNTSFGSFLYIHYYLCVIQLLKIILKWYNHRTHPSEWLVSLLITLIFWEGRGGAIVAVKWEEELSQAPSRVWTPPPEVHTASALPLPSSLFFLFPQVHPEPLRLQENMAEALRSDNANAGHDRADWTSARVPRRPSSRDSWVWIPGQWCWLAQENLFFQSKQQKPYLFYSLAYYKNL